MSAPLDRPGIFKARPLAWKVVPSTKSQSVAVAIDYQITAELNGSEWVDWTAYQPMGITGYHYVVKADGTPNINTVEQIAFALGWDGNLRKIVQTAPPDGIEVQITVKAETYNGKEQLKVQWLNPGDHTPTATGADEQEVAQLDAQFGSLLRAAAAKPPGASKPAPTRPAAPKPAAPAAPAAAPPTDFGDIPF